MAFKSDTSVIEGGVYTPGYKSELTGRQDPILGTIRDTDSSCGVECRTMNDWPSSA